MILRIVKVLGIVGGALLVTALGIDASDTLRGASGTLLSQVIRSSDTGPCPTGMAPFQTPLGAQCVDMYEVSPGDNCEHADPQNALESRMNVESRACTGESVAGKIPWRHITREQAAAVCAKTGKRLPSNEEWYQASLGTPDTATTDPQGCNTDGQEYEEAGSRTACRSASGAYDMIGNVWEWTKDDVFDGAYNGRALPRSGYVTQVDQGGVAVYSDSETNELFSEDYVWTKPEGAFGILRGGFYGNGTDAGVYALNAYAVPTTPGTAIGFRCVQ